MKQKFTLFFFLLFITLTNSQTFSGTVGTVSDDGQPNDFTATVSGLSSNQLNASLGLIQVCLDISHTYDSDLNVYLIAPDGTTINLFSGIGGGDDNFSNTCLNQSATNSINTAVAPFTGTFKPQETLGNCNNNQNGNGVWKLRIIDTYAQDEGNLNSVTDIPNDFNGNITIESRGAYSQSLPQKPYKITTVDTESAELNVSLLGMPEEHDWNLIANYNDKVFMRNKLAYQVFTDMGHYAARNQYCEVVVNGIYQGIYLLMESIKRDNNRVDIAKLETTENTGIDLTGGYILKNDYWTTENSWQTQFQPIDHPELDVHLVYDYPKANLKLPSV